MLHDPRRRQPPRRSASAPLELTIQEDPFLAILDEVAPLFARYGQESGKAAVDPNWQGMMQMATIGMLRMVTLRQGGMLIGFCLNLLSRPIMYKTTLFGTTVCVFIDKPFRFGMNGLKLLRRNKELLLEWGCQRLYLATPEPRMAKVFERLGYRFEETHYVSEADAGLCR